MIQAYTRPAYHGAAWIREGVGLFRQAPITWALIMACGSVLASLACRVVPQPLALPVLTALNTCFFVSFLTVAKTIHTEQQPTLFLLFSGFSNQVLGLLAVGFLEGGLLFAIIKIWISQHPILQQLGSSEAVAMAKIFKETMDFTFFLYVMIFVVIKALLGYAPGLIVFYDISPVKAVVFSMIGVTRNWRAWIVYVFGLIAFWMAPLFLLAILGSFVAAASLSVVYILLIYSVCVVLPVVYGSVYVSLTDVFRVTRRVSVIA